MEEEIKRWTAKRKSALVMEIIQGKKTVAEAGRQLDLPPSEVEDSEPLVSDRVSRRCHPWLPPDQCWSTDRCLIRGDRDGWLTLHW